MSFKRVSKPDHLDHLLTRCPQIVNIWSIWTMCQKQAVFQPKPTA